MQLKFQVQGVNKWLKVEGVRYKVKDEKTE